MKLPRQIPTKLYFVTVDTKRSKGRIGYRTGPGGGKFTRRDAAEQRIKHLSQFEIYCTLWESCDITWLPMGGSIAYDPALDTDPLF